MLKRRLCASLFAVLLLVSLASSAYGSSFDPARYGTPLTQAEMSATEGQWGLLITGAIAGAVTGAARYATSAEDHNVQDLLREVGMGALSGAASSCFGLAGKIAAGAPIGFSVAETAWAVWAGANVGALSGAITAAIREW